MFRKLLGKKKPATVEGAGEGMNKETTPTYGTVTDLPLQTPNSQPSPQQSPKHLPTNPPNSPEKVTRPGIINAFFKVDSEKSLGNLAPALQTNQHARPQRYELLPVVPEAERSAEFVEVPLSPTNFNDTAVLVDQEPKETTLRILGEVFLPFLLAGIGCVFAGVVLDLIKTWEVFKHVSEIFILVPALLGLKGNLEMTLASRLSTQANLGNMDTRQEQWKMVYGNLALTQVQAIIVGLAASLFAMVLGWVPEGKFNLRHGLLMASSSVLTASLATLILGSLMIGVVLVSRRFSINPDNVATPIAASLGDLTTISLLAFICQFLYTLTRHHQWVSILILIFMLGLVPLGWYVSHNNVYTNEVLYTGWVPVIGAMLISSFGGLVLDYAVNKFHGMAVFQPVMNGVGGNLVAVQASRLSTALHKVATPGELPEGAVSGCPNPITSFFGQANSARAARVMVLMVIPGHLLFMLIIFLVQQTTDFRFSALFVFLFVVAAILQVVLLLYTANALVHFLWSKGNDPDNSAIPYLTAIGDLLGTSLLAVVFLIISK